MRAKIRTLLGEDDPLMDRFLAWAVADGVLQGLALATLVPLIDALLAADAARFWRWLAVLVVVTVLAMVAHYRQGLAAFRVAAAVLRHLQLRIGDHIVGLPLGWFGAGRAGTVSLLATKGVMSQTNGAAHMLTPVVVGITSAVTVVVCTLVIEWRLGLGLAAFVPVLWWAQRWGLRLADQADHRSHAISARINDQLLEYARCQPALRAAGRGATYAPLEHSLAEQRAASSALLWRQVLGLAIGSVVVQTAASMVVTVGAQLGLGGQLRPGLVVGTLALCLRFTQPLAEALENLSGVRQSLHDLERIEKLLAEPTLPTPVGAAARGDGSIELDRVWFGYGDEPVTRDVSFRVAPGTMTALVGPSGSGKTTLTKLIARFHDVDAGVVRVGGDDVRDLTTEQLMAQLSLVFQDVYLFDDTLEANVRLGRPEATAAELAEVARLAGVDEIVERLPHGWTTRVGEGGAMLSGGERQRVSIARALLKAAPIVLLDEATAALDPENERHIVGVLTRLTQTSTVLVIAHRLHTIVGADQIVVLSAQGSVLDVGRHEELLGRCGQYAGFWSERLAARGWRLRAGADLSGGHR